MSLPEIDFHRLAYQALRQQDCRLNRLEDTCLRTYALDYHDYRRLREAFLKGYDTMIVDKQDTFL